MIKVVKEFDMSDSKVDVVEIINQIDNAMNFNENVLTASDMTSYKGQYNEIIWSYLKDLVEVERLAKQYCELESDSLMKISNGDYKYVPPNQVHFDSPSHELNNLFDLFTIQSIIVIRKVNSLFDKMYPEVIKSINKSEGKAKARSNHCRSLMRPTSIFANFFQRLGWIKELYDIRGDAEHSGKPSITSFDVEIDTITNKAIVILPEVVSNKKLASNYLLETFRKLHLFCADFPVMLFSLEMKKELHIVALKADNDRGFRFEVQFTSEIRKRLSLMRDE